MSLSSELASQFAKVTNDTARNTNGTKLHGTITMLGEVPYVRLDGTEELTPISRTVEVAEGDRVEVTIANHSATVTGNLTDPSIGIMRAGALESSITQTASEIRLELSNEVSKLNSSLTLTASKIRTELSDGISGLDSKITLTASEIRTELSDGISGLNSKITQNANSISTLVKNDEAFSEFQQTVEGFYFINDEGIVKIKNGNLDLTGSITFSDFNQTVADEINAISDTADSALDTANTASSTAASAKSLANTAMADASDAYNEATSAAGVARSIANGTYVNGTFINKKQITSPTIIGNEIKVHGTFQTIGYDGVTRKPTGYMGAAMGKDSYGNDTFGVALSHTWNYEDGTIGNSYMIVTNAGVRMQYNNNQVIVSSGGVYINTPGSAKAYYNDVEIGSGSGSSVVAVWG